MSLNDRSPLHSFLSRRLPELGLDYETYGPYITGAIDAGVDDENDNEEIDGVLELLRSSSESHSDDVDAWDKFREELVTVINEARQEGEKRKEAKLQRSKEAEMEKARQARLEAERHQEELDRDAAEGRTVDEEKKKRIEALVSRFGYEAEDGEDDGNADAADGEEGAVQSNREMAEAARKAQVQKAREDASKSRDSKKTARETTAKHKAEKNQKKEERKKRAQKGERKR